MPIGQSEWIETNGPVFAGVTDQPGAVGFGQPGSGSDPGSAPFVRVAPSADFDTAQIAIGDTAALIVPGEGSRRTLELRNFGTDTVYIARRAQVLDAGNGYPLKADERKLLETAGEVWAKCASGEATTIAVLAEYEVPVVTS